MWFILVVRSLARSHFKSRSFWRAIHMPVGGANRMGIPPKTRTAKSGETPRQVATNAFRFSAESIKMEISSPPQLRCRLSGPVRAGMLLQL